MSDKNNKNLEQQEKSYKKLFAILGRLFYSLGLLFALIMLIQHGFEMII